jgi:hypothetical protein
MTGSDDRKAGPDPDGIRVFDARPRRPTGLVVAAACVVALLIAIVAVSRREPAVDGPPLVVSAQSTDVAPKKVVRAPSTPSRELPVASTSPPPSPTSPPMKTSPPRPSTVHDSDDRAFEGLVRDAYEHLTGHGNGEGIAAFPPKGTNPVKTGLVVPDDYQLPEGYVRYYQTTDEGQRLEAILMFSPDYDFVDASGNKIELPATGIVPPEMAPPGLPIRMLEIPADPAATRAKR